VNSIHPGVVETEMSMTAIRERLQAMGEDVGLAQSAAAANPLGRVGAAADVAGMAVYLASESSSFVAGAELVIDGGLTAR
jgi:NAD(P)-dependent dehydrogenase (short-subunit alcohol dehydrogenase family)